MNISLKGWCLVIVAACGFASSSVSAELKELPTRTTPIPLTTNGIPHIQIDVEAVPEISEDLLRRVSEIPSVELRDTIQSLPGAMGFWLDEDVELLRPDVIVRGREFAHLHPDGSLHATLPPDLATMAVQNGWATPHPWASRKPDLRGFVMIYTPTSTDELHVVFQLVVESYNFVTGKDMASTGE